MDDHLAVARIAELVAEPARARILWTLIDGTTRPAGELAYAANVSAQSASSHLAKLLRGGLLSVESHGRHRYFRLVNADVAGVLEGMASLGSLTLPRAPRSAALPPAEPPQFLYARTCYGHLAGEMAVKILEAMIKRKWLRAAGRDFTLTKKGEDEIAALGVDIAQLRKSRRRTFARACIDLTQRRPHLGGALGEALLQSYVDRGWIERHRRSRVVTITPSGHHNFPQFFGM